MFYSIGFLVAGLLVADFLTGFFHWLEDSYCSRGLPLVGKLVCEPNIEHHQNPSLIAKTGSFVSRNILQWSMALVTIAICGMVGTLDWFWTYTICVASFGNEVHRWNHDRKCGAIIRFIKSTGIIQSEKQHALHHKPPHLDNYCTLTSFLNPFLDTLRFWRIMERTIYIFTGKRPEYESRTV